MTLDEMWTRALAYLLAWAYDDDVSLVHVWSAISTKMPEEYWSDKETHMTNTLKLLEHCLKEGYLVAGETFRYCYHRNLLRVYPRRATSLGVSLLWRPGA
jgi:hypothetical protein